MKVWTVEEAIEGEGVLTLAITDSEEAATEFRRRLLEKRHRLDSDSVGVEQVDVLTLATIATMDDEDIQ